MTIIDHQPRCIQQPSSRPAAAPVTCQPWCWLGDGHPREFVIDDQTCMTDDPAAVDTGTTEIGAHASYRHRLSTTTVTVFSERYADGHGLCGSEDLTVAEARAFAAQLVAVCDTIEGVE